MTVMMLFIIALCAVANAQQPEEECPSGMQKRGSVCCKTVKCGLNEDYRLCNDTHTEDACIPCTPNTFNHYGLDTSLEYYHGQHQNVCKKATEICVKTACLAEATIVNFDECLRNGIVTCECDLSRGFCGEDPRTCRTWGGNKTEIKKGMELTLNCKLKKCSDGNFKDIEGYGKCHKHRECSNEEIISNGTSTMNTQCNTSNATQGMTKGTDISDVNSTVGNSSTPISPNNKDTAGHDWIVVLVFFGTAVLMVIVIVIVCICRRRKQRGTGRDNHGNANSGDLGQNEQEMTERETMMPNGDHVA